MPKSILGHASEAKNSVFLENAHAPHFAYVGDSILGNNTNLGAGTKLSNLTLISEKDKESGIRPTIKLHIDGREYDTGLAKFGAILGDGTQTGCNSVLNPGCVIGKRSLVYANMSLRKGYYPAESVMKLRQTTKILKRRFVWLWQIRLLGSVLWGRRLQQQLIDLDCDQCLVIGLLATHWEDINFAQNRFGNMGCPIVDATAHELY